MAAPEATDRPNEALWKALVEASPDAIIYTDRAGTIRVWNSAAERIFGYGAAEVIGRNLDVIVPERLRAAHWKGFEAAVESGHEKYAGRVLTTRSEHRNGTRLYIDLAFALLRDSAGAVIGVLATARDCTESYAEQRTLRARVAELEAASAAGGGSPQ